ncbi:MAG: bifunctional folylpolyglutamate synthase/dihydrofolate synthase [Acidimicrobiales bacterium]
MDSHQDLEKILSGSRYRAPNRERMRRLAYLMGDPQASLPVLHLTGTNGKTSTARALSQLLISKGLNVGTFTSPHLENLNERIMVGLEPVPDADLAEVLSDLAGLEPLMDERPTWFEVITAAAFRYFADRPVDVAVVEVGMGGRWDATNVADADVAVVTNIALDHTELLGPTRMDIAKEKAGIVKPGATLVLGETDPSLYGTFAAEEPAVLWLSGRDFSVDANVMAVGGRLLDLRTPSAHYDGVYLPLHGRHQAHNFLAALVAAEAFFGAPLEHTLVEEAAAEVRSPGRLEVAGRSPLVVLDGAKNVAGAQASAVAVAEEFGEAKSRVLVVGMLKGKDAREMLEALDAHKARLVVTCPPPSPRAQPADEVAEAARSLGCRAVASQTVLEALDLALAEAGGDELVLVTGSLYVVGAARHALAQGGTKASSPVQLPS